VDGTKIAEQTLDNTQPGEFFEVTYPIPQALTQSKDKVMVRFRAHPSELAGGFFGAQIVQR
jgi:hypothetical protein